MPTRKLDAQMEKQKMESEKVGNGPAEHSPAGPDFCSLPEGCLADVLALTSPRDACRISAVALAFLSAAESDALWERFLPADYREIMALSSDPSSWRQFSSKKKLYMSLCDSPVSIDGGTKNFWLEKKSGKKCCMWGAKELSIIWAVDTPWYWEWISLPGSRFAEVARLKSVWWFEIKGNLNASILSPNTNYAAYLVFRSEQHCDGFKRNPFESSIEVIGKEACKRLVCLAVEDRRRQRRENDHTSQSATSVLWYPKRRRDGWVEVELGEFFIAGGEDMELRMSLMEVKTHKSGIIVEGIEIRPKDGWIN